MTCKSDTCPYCRDNILQGCNNKGHKGYSPPRVEYRETRVALIKKHTIKGKVVDGKYELPQPTEFESYPATWEFLTMMVWEEDQSKRETGTILVFADGTGLKVMLNDRDRGSLAFATVKEPAGLLETVEAVLLDPEHEWKTPKKFVPSKK